MLIDSYPCYVVRKDESRNWHWVYYDKHGEEIARSINGYTDQDDCVATISRIQRSQEDLIFYEP